MNLLKSISATAIVLMAVGCEQSSTPGPNMPDIRLATAVNSYTRAQGLDFETGDHFGLFLIAYEGATAPEFGVERFRENLMCTKTATGINLPRVYYPETGKLDFYAYFPYSVAGISSPDQQWLPHSVAANQADPLFYNSSDFLTAVVRGVTPSESAVPLVFTHRMSLVNVQLLPGSGMTPQGLKNARMKTGMLASDCRVDLVTGEVTDVKGAISIIPNGNQVSVIDDKVSMMSFITAPQTIPAGMELFDITIGAKHYKYVTDRDIELKSGYKYLMEITLQPAAAQTIARMTAMPR